MRKAIIYMEVACGHCGGIINRNYKNSTSVKWLKNATSDWRYTKEYGNICPKEEMKSSPKFPEGNFFKT